MNADNTIQHPTTIRPLLESARRASLSLLSLTDTQRSATLTAVADALVEATDTILRANTIDLSRMDPADSRYDRLRLTPERIHAIANDTRNVASLPSPLVTLEQRTLPNGLHLTKQAVPFGVIGVIYESRPNVTADVFSLCFKSGNVAVLKGSHDAAESNAAIASVIKGVLAQMNIPEEALTLLPSTREATAEMLRSRGLIDLIIPRGSKRLIDFVRSESTVPVIETGAGVCHCFVDSIADIDMASAIIANAKTRRVSVCNALDCLIINSNRLADLPALCAPLQKSEVTIHADVPSLEALRGHYPDELLVAATDDDFGTEYLGYAMAIKTVDSLNDAIDHIALYGSGHSESIVTGNSENARQFQREVDAACVYVNAPTSWTDGAQFGLGAEIGISTQKLHARGPMALREITTYKWLIDGSGQCRP